jgi:GT2 family glycosyltransferase
MVELAETDSGVAAVQPKLVSYFDHSCFEYAGASGGMIDKYGYPFLRGRLFGSIEQDTRQYDTIIETFWATGASIFIRKDALLKSGVLDETIVHHMDEIDLCWRFRMHGYKVLVQPKSLVHHIGGATIQTKSFKKIYWNHRNSIYIMMKNYELKQVIKYVPVHVLLDYVAIAQALLSANFTLIRGILAAHIWIILHILLIIRKRVVVQSERTHGDDKILPYMYQRSVVWQHFVKKINNYNQLPEIHTYEYNINQRNTQWTQSVTA